jgi:hypothetical protein
MIFRSEGVGVGRDVGCLHKKSLARWGPLRDWVTKVPCRKETPRMCAVFPPQGLGLAGRAPHFQKCLASSGLIGGRLVPKEG